MVGDELVLAGDDTGFHFPLGQTHRKGHPLAHGQKLVNEGGGVRLPTHAVEDHHGVGRFHLGQSQKLLQQVGDIGTGKGCGLPAQPLLELLGGHAM